LHPKIQIFPAKILEAQNRTKEWNSSKAAITNGQSTCPLIGIPVLLMEIEAEVTEPQRHNYH